MLLLAATLLTSQAFASAPPDESEDIRILLGAGRGPLQLAGLSVSATPEVGPASRFGGGPVRIGCGSGGVMIQGKSLGGTASFSAEGPIAVLGRKVRGRVEVGCDGTQWRAINVLPLETYLSAVLGGEMPSSFPPEALKAQAVAARSYALMRKIDVRDQGRPYHLDSTVLSQVYAGLAEEDPRTRAAVEATRGEVLAEGPTPVEAYFHASCGGETESGEAALGRNLDYLKPVECPCRGHSPYAKWQVEIRAAVLGAAVGLPAAVDAEVKTQTHTGRAALIRIQGTHGEERTIGAAKLRAALGYQRLPSTWFDIHKRGLSFVFEGRGSGHGAGLCQWGARLLAEGGQSYRQILSHYYPGTDLLRIY